MYAKTSGPPKRSPHKPRHGPSALNGRNNSAPGGRLVAPLRINGLTRSVTFEYTGGVWRSLDMDECSFMPMRGPDQTPSTTYR